jgi:orotate phosphoribosyltransferase
VAPDERNKRSDRPGYGRPLLSGQTTGGEGTLVNFVPLSAIEANGLALPIDSETSMEALIAHLQKNALKTDGPFVLRSGATSDWYLDARQTTYSGEGARLVGQAILSVLDDSVVAVGGMTMGADPVALSTALMGAEGHRPLRAFSIRAQAKDHGAGGRLVGPVAAGDAVAVVEDTVTTGSAMLEAIDVLTEAGIDVIQAISVVDRSDGAAGRRIGQRGIPFVALLRPADLGVG